MNKSMYDYLCCPLCKNDFKRNASSFTCLGCKRTYEIRFGIPILVDLLKLPDHLHKQIRYFEKEDEVRGDWALETWQARYVKNFLDFGQPKPAGIIVDEATGSGYMAVELAKLGFRVIATDLTLKELVKLKRKLEKLGLSEKVLLICANSENLPIKSKVADGLIANAILEHLPNEKEAIGGITRVVKKGAVIMVAVPIAYRYILPILWPINWLHDKRIGHLRRYSRSQILRKFLKFQEECTYYTGGIIKVLCVMTYFLTKNMWFLQVGEQFDERIKNIPYGASNIVSILKKL